MKKAILSVFFLTVLMIFSVGASDIFGHWELEGAFLPETLILEIYEDSTFVAAIEGEDSSSGEFDINERLNHITLYDFMDDDLSMYFRFSDDGNSVEFLLDEEMAQEMSDSMGFGNEMGYINETTEVFQAAMIEAIMEAVMSVPFLRGNRIYNER